MSIGSTPSATAATAAARSTATGATGAWAGLLAAQRIGVLTRAILLLLTLCLESQRAEHDDALTFLQSAHDFREVQVSLSELYDARVEDRLRAIRDEDKTLSRALRTAPHLGRRCE